jgi:cellulose synthase/poly-beta-1,6-N-acetylglucosamine synthase-like glycosyltransferase
MAQDKFLLYFLLPGFLFLYTSWILLSILASNKKTLLGTTSPELKATILICARNEALNLKKFLPSWLQQQYKNFEVLVINHQSDDESEEILQDYAKIYPQLRYYNVGKGKNIFKDKKQALYEGFRLAAGDVILLTDADCSPSANEWVSTMMQYFTDTNVEIVAGWAPMHSGSGLLDTTIRFETANTFYLMDLFSHLGFPFMAIGRNMAIRKSSVKESYWEKYRNIGFGDDDMLVQEYGRSDNMIICSKPEAAVYSIPKKSWREWVIQKIRHQKAGFHYNKVILFGMAAYHTLIFMRLAILFLLFPCIIKNYTLIYFLLLILILSWIQYKSLKKITRIGLGFGKYFLMQQLMIIYYFLFPILTLVYKNQIWKRNTLYQ